MLRFLGFLFNSGWWIRACHWTQAVADGWKKKLLIKVLKTGYLRRSSKAHNCLWENTSLSNYPLSNLSIQEIYTALITQITCWLCRNMRHFFCCCNLAKKSISHSHFTAGSLRVHHIALYLKSLGGGQYNGTELCSLFDSSWAILMAMSLPHCQHGIRGISRHDMNGKTSSSSL